MKMNGKSTRAAQLKSLLKRAANEYGSRKKTAEEQVTRWKHYSGPFVDPRPFYFERFGFKQGRSLKSATKRAFSYGFDDRGSIVVARQPGVDDEPAYEEFFSYHEHSVETLAYRLAQSGTIHYASIQYFNQGQIIACDVLDAGGTVELFESYSYRNGRVNLIECVSRDGRERDTVCFDVVYDQDGEWLSVRRRWDEMENPIFVPACWNPKKSPKVDSLSFTIRQKLLTLIPKVVAQAKIVERAYCLAIAYDAENDLLPPLIGVGLEKERSHLLATSRSTALKSLWNPAEFSRYEDGTLDLDDKELDDSCQIFCQLTMSKGDTWSERKLLNGVASELNRHDWSEVLPITDDFVVFAVDFEGSELKKNMKAGVPLARLRLLRMRKLL